jgi:hypothetical protein
MSEPTRKTIPLWQRLTAGGSVRQQVAGAQARIKDGDKADAPQATWYVKAASLGGLVPRAGDKCRGTDGVWRAVKEVAAITEAGEWPCVLEKVAE